MRNKMEKRSIKEIIDLYNSMNKSGNISTELVTIYKNARMKEIYLLPNLVKSAVARIESGEDLMNQSQNHQIKKVDVDPHIVRSRIEQFSKVSAQTKYALQCKQTTTEEFSSNSEIYDTEQFGDHELENNSSDFQINISENNHDCTKSHFSQTSFFTKPMSNTYFGKEEEEKEEEMNQFNYDEEEAVEQTGYFKNLDKDFEEIYYYGIQENGIIFDLSISEHAEILENLDESFKRLEETNNNPHVIELSSNETTKVEVIKHAISPSEVKQEIHQPLCDTNDQFLQHWVLHKDSNIEVIRVTDDQHTSMVEMPTWENKSSKQNKAKFESLCKQFDNKIKDSTKEIEVKDAQNLYRRWSAENIDLRMNQLHLEERTAERYNEKYPEFFAANIKYFNGNAKDVSRRKSFEDIGWKSIHSNPNIFTISTTGAVRRKSFEDTESKPINPTLNRLRKWSSDDTYLLDNNEVNTKSIALGLREWSSDINLSTADNTEVFHTTIIGDDVIDLNIFKGSEGTNESICDKFVSINTLRDKLVNNEQVTYAPKTLEDLLEEDEETVTDGGEEMEKVFHISKKRYKNRRIVRCNAVMKGICILPNLVKNAVAKIESGEILTDRSQNYKTKEVDVEPDSVKSRIEHFSKIITESK